VFLNLRSRVAHRKSGRTYFKHLMQALQKKSRKTLALLAKPMNWVLLRAAHQLVELASWQGSTSTLQPGVEPVSVLFVPYPYPATRTLHSILAGRVRNLGHHATMASTAALSDQGGVSADDVEGFEDRSFESVDEAVQFLNFLGSGDEILSTAIIDEFVRYCPVSFFTEHHLVSRDFQVFVRRAVRTASAWAEAHRVVVVGDSSYLANGAVISAFLKQHGKVFAADFPGTFREITKRKSERRNRDFFYSELEKLRGEDNSAVNPDETLEQYFSERYSGNSSDPEIAQAFNKRGNSHTSCGGMKKVLFLHSFRDANGQVASVELGSSLFRTYFQWADAALAIVAESPQDWVVKSHPSFARLAGDIEILLYLLDKHKIPPAIVNPGLTSGFVLKNRWPIFTHDGTIAREAASLGYKAVSISVHLPEEITTRLTSIEDFNLWYRLPPSEVNGEDLDEITCQAARRMFFDHVRQDLNLVVRRRHQIPGKSYLFLQLLPARISLTLAKMSLTRAGREEISQATARLL